MEELEKVVLSIFVDYSCTFSPSLAWISRVYCICLLRQGTFLSIFKLLEGHHDYNCNSTVIAYLCTITPWSWVLEKLIVIQLVKFRTS
jgi:hypothetical protein